MDEMTKEESTDVMRGEEEEWTCGWKLKVRMWCGAGVDNAYRGEEEDESRCGRDGQLEVSSVEDRV